MKNLIILSAIIFSSYYSQAQIEQTITLPTDQFGDTYPGLLYLPSTYSSGSTNYPLIVFLHGAGESNPPLSTIYNNSNAGGPAYFIEHGGWPVSFVSPADGKPYQFIVVSPQAVGSSWSTSGSQLNYMIQSLVKSYRIDVSRIYLTGLSAGGAGIVQYMINQADDGSAAPAPMYLPAAWLPMSEAFGAPAQAAMNIAVSDGAKVWGFGDPVGDPSHGQDTKSIIDEMNSTKPGIAMFTSYTGGHCCWGQFYNPTFSLNGKSIYQWMLQFTHQGNPAPGTITPPVIPPVVPPVVPPVTPPSTGTRKYLTPDPGDQSIYISWASQFNAGDTIAFKSSVKYGTVEIHGLTGAPGKPIVIINEGGQAHLAGFLKLYDCKYVHVSGSGVPGVKYGLLVQVHPSNIVGTDNNAIGFQLSERSKCVEVNNIFINHTFFGMAIKQSPDCPDSLNYPNWIMDSILIHDNLIRKVSLEGMYIGDTSPDNGPKSTDPRYVIGCHLPAVLDTLYPRPIRSGHFHIWNNTVDSTGRGGIQLSGHSVSIAEIDSNWIADSGEDGDEQQGTGISVGMYTHAYIHDNTIRRTTTWGIASLGGSGTNVPLQIIHNTLDSIGLGNHYNNVTDSAFPITPSRQMFGPLSGVPAGNSYIFANPIFVKTATNMDFDSTRFWIQGNIIGSYLAESKQSAASSSSSIQVFDYAATPMFQKEGNIISGNVRTTGAAASVFVDAGIQFTGTGSTPPPVTIPPNVSAGSSQSIAIPPSSVPLVGSASGNGGATIKALAWSQKSGPNTATISPSGQASAVASNLISGVYIFQLTATDNNGLSSSASVTITATAAVVVPPVCPPPIVCPVCPAARTVVSVSIVAGSVIITFSDGKTQKL